MREGRSEEGKERVKRGGGREGGREGGSEKGRAGEKGRKRVKRGRGGRDHRVGVEGFEVKGFNNQAPPNDLLNPGLLDGIMRRPGANLGPRPGRGARPGPGPGPGRGRGRGQGQGVAGRRTDASASEAERLFSVGGNNGCFYFWAAIWRTLWLMSRRAARSL